MSTGTRRLTVWDRSVDLGVSIAAAKLLDYLGLLINTDAVDGVEASVCEATTAEPPVPLTGRGALDVPYDADLGIWHTVLPYEDDLDALASVRVVVVVVLSGRPQRVLDALASFYPADGR